MHRFYRLSLFWQVYSLIVFVLVLVVGLTEFIFEPWAEMLVLGKADSEGIDWYEAPAWAMSILIISIACGLIISRKLTRRLSAMAQAARTLAKGNLNVRLPVDGDPQNGFDDLAQSFNHMADAVARQLEEERRLLADIAHELRSPLTRMAVAVELLEKTHDSERKATTLLRLEKEIRQMGDLISHLLAQSREHCREKALPQVREFAPALQNILEDYMFQANKRNISIQASLDATASVQASTAQLRTIFGNILGNAVFYSPQGGVITVSLFTNEDTTSIVVRDRGPGVPDEELQEIFRAFYRVDESRARTNGGVGLGLALAKAEAARLGGDIRAENAFPGLRVIIVLPLAEKDEFI